MSDSFFGVFMSLTSNLLDKYGTVSLTDKWILFPDGHIADCHGNEFNYADWSKGQPYKSIQN